VALSAAQMSYLLEAIDWRNPQHTWLRRDNLDGNTATIRMRMRRCRGDEGRA
jgi:hypothetical protein